MSTRKNDDRLEAFNAIVSLLSKFDDETQRHVLASVANWFGLQHDSIAQTYNEPPQAEGVSNHTIAHRFSDSSGDMLPKEFVLQKNPQTNTERIACLAFYLTHYRSTPHFKTFELSKLNTEAAQPKFPNASYSVRDAVTAGLLVPGPKGTKQLSAMGEQFVMALPDRDAAREALVKMKKRNKRRKSLSKRTSSAK